MVQKIRLSISNAYLVCSDLPVLIDSGVAGDYERLLKAIRRHGVEPESLQWILHTHGHSDHCGCTKSLVEISGAKTAIHRNELDRVRAGHHGEIRARDWMARAMHRFLNPEFPPFAVDRVFEGEDDGASLGEFGLEGEIVPTPGHTGGSVSFIMTNGDAVIGDLFRGSVWRPNHPRLPFFYDDSDAIRASVRRLLESEAQRFLPGHFGIMDRNAVQRWHERALI